jgi:hypothetical protein
MSGYAARIEAGTVTNVIVGDAPWARESLGGVWEDCDENIGIGWTFTVAEGFRPPRPYPSWGWQNGAWTAPVPRPEGYAIWDEATLTWTVLDV